MFERFPAAFEQRVGALGRRAQRTDDGVAGLMVGVQVVALGGDLDADPRADVALVGQRRQAARRGRVQRCQGVGPGRR